MDRSSSPDYKALYLRAEEDKRKAEEGKRKAEEGKRKAEEERDQGRERTRLTTFLELLRLCHSLFSLQLRVETPSRSTTGKIPPPTGKYCPLRLRHWEDCHARQQEVYRSICAYLETPGETAAPLFSPRLVLEDLGQRFGERAISSEQDLESYERFGVENYVHDIIAELCKNPAARDQFGLGDGVKFDNHANALDQTEADLSLLAESSTYRRSRPDQFCIRRVDGERNTLLTTVEYKPPHKLSVENLRAGLREMNFWEEVVQPNSIPTEESAKLSYNAAWLTGSAITQEYHVMIQEGLEYSYLTNGLALVLLRVPYDEPGTLYYHLCEPNMEIDLNDDQSFDQPLTTIARVLCLCLLCFGAPVRDQAWRNKAQKQLPVWKTSFDHTRSQIPESELRQNPPSSEYSPSVSSGRSVSEYLPSSSPVESPTQRRRIPTRSRAQCAPNTMEREDSPDSDTDSAPGFSQVTSSPSSPSVQRSARQTGTRPNEHGRYQHNAQFCTQRCLLGLQRGGTLDDCCPNVQLHRQGGTSNQHLIDASGLVRRIKQQLDQNLDVDCTPMGGCGASGAPFKITCTSYGYTVVGKGTTSYLWNEVKREADIYRILWRAQGRAVPVFLGTIDLAMIYFLHGAGQIRHMLLMGWGGEPIHKLEDVETIRHEVSRSQKKIRSLGVLHQDLRPDNMLWNAELERVLIIDFHRSQLDSRPMNKRMRLREQHSCGAEVNGRKRHRIGQ
ncbi:hypothetical protein BO79DRAFT_54504 [Aspergillus costaricaensis CBS 115574]|uniref:Uncharacterized protein n=1 Tax=Aspergillus costaricaensis CBS 115574 TaxID=1448317 RepID=A0ACD1IQP9_9EURO|nr:hypothetical protein BO79DRAFT_54504 [Aspergillus costaricaensis CBS 115574]RAK92604.1 hypothetical protein BO79DRAFT_54504 [Aspergillus costaricaensis CBS 115574]